MEAKDSLHDSDIPYFCWDRPWTVADIRQRLQAADATERDRLIAWILREAAFRDVWLFLSPSDVQEALPRVTPFLGRWREFWPYIMGMWHELGRIQ